MQNALELRDVQFNVKAGRKRRRRILDGVSLEVARGSSVAVVGPSGAGKSTLLGVCMGLIEPESGTVTVAGTDLTRLSTKARTRVRGRHIGVVFQSGELIHELTPLENVMLPVMLSGDTANDLQARASALMVSLGLDLEDTPTDRLSGGERQRVAVARALINSPDLLLADEPTGALDAQTRDRVADLVFGMAHEHGCGLLVVTHDEQVAARADRVMRLQDAQLHIAS